MERPVCGYCNMVVPKARHQIVNNSDKVVIHLCTDGDNSCLMKWERAEKARRHLLYVIAIGADICAEPLACEERIRKATISGLGEIVKTVIKKIKAAEHRIKSAFVGAWASLMAHLRQAAAILGVREIAEAI